MSGSSITHTPVNDFNSEQVKSFLAKGFNDVVSRANTPNSGFTLYKPTSGAWTSSKPAPSGSSSRVLSDLSKSLKSLESSSSGASSATSSTTDSPAEKNNPQNGANGSRNKKK